MANLKNTIKKCIACNNSTTPIQYKDTFISMSSVEGIPDVLYVDESTGDIYIWNGSEYITAEGGGGIDRFHTNIVGTAPYDPLLPLTGWVAPSSPIAGNTVEVKFTDGTVANYTYDGTVWGVDFIDKTLAQHDLRLLTNGTIERGSDSDTDTKGAQFLHDSYSHLNGFSDNWISNLGAIPSFQINENGNIGVSFTNAPNAKLDIVNTSEQNILRLKQFNNSNATPSIQLLSSTNSELLRVHSDHESNTFVGRLAGLNNIPSAVTSGQSITAFGSAALENNISGYASDAFGTGALANNTIGVINCAIGYQSLFNNISGSENTALGTDAGYSNNGNKNFYIGFHSGKKLSGTITGNRNMFIGYETAHKLTSGEDNTVIGYYAGHNITTGYLNTIIGNLAGNLSSTGYFNSYIGAGSGEDNIIGFENTFLGFRSGQRSTTSYNTYIGNYSGQLNINGSSNVALGYQSGAGVDASQKTAIGYRAGYNGGSDGVYLGYRAGDLETAANKLYIHNNNSTTPLIGGDFSTQELKIGGVQQFSIQYPTTGVGVANGSMFYGTDGALYFKGGSGTVTLIGPA